MSRQHVEIIDGREYTVTRLPQDRRLTSSEARKRILWDTLTPGQKEAEIRKRKQKSRPKRRRTRGAYRVNGEKWPSPVQTPLEGWLPGIPRPRETRAWLTPGCKSERVQRLLAVAVGTPIRGHDMTGEDLGIADVPTPVKTGDLILLERGEYRVRA